MRTKFQFPYTCGKIRFNGPQKLSLSATGSVQTQFDKSSNQKLVLNDSPIDITIEPDAKREEHSKIDGNLYLEVPGAPEVACEFAQMLAHDVAQYLTFFYGFFELNEGMVTGERIPENNDEKNEIGEGTYWVQVNFVEAQTPPSFDNQIFKLFPKSIPVQRLICQYNSAKSSNNLVDIFLGMFKVIETQFHVGKGFAKKTLVENETFREIVMKKITFKSFSGEISKLSNDQLSDFVSRLVDTRNKCAHLRDGNNFGYGPRDPEVFEEVKPFSALLDLLARESILDQIVEHGTEINDPLFFENSEAKA